MKYKKYTIIKQLVIKKINPKVKPFLLLQFKRFSFSKIVFGKSNKAPLKIQKVGMSIFKGIFSVDINLLIHSKSESPIF